MSAANETNRKAYFIGVRKRRILSGELKPGDRIPPERELAAELGTSTEMVEAKLERYAQLGYVKKTVMSADCGGNCKKCHGCSGMKNAAASVVYWERIK